jgi:DICT domain-containing protein
VTPTHLHLTPVSADAPLLREWLLVCDSPGYAVCLVGWEQPGPSGLPDQLRPFETVWTVDPRAVRTAATLAAGHVEPYLSQEAADSLARRLADQPAPASVDLERATSLFQRLVSYVD